MNFYFCEKCGKRVTEVDLQEGEAKDKKLKGVYCTECAIGVNTMEMQPLSPVQAREILQQTPKPLKPVHQAPAHETPSRRLGPPLRASGNPADRSTAQSSLLIFFIVGSILALGVGVWLLTRSRGGRESAADRSASQKSPPPKIISSEPPSLAQPSLPVTSPLLLPSPTALEQASSTEEKATPERRAQLAFDELVKFEGLSAEDQKGRVDRIRAFLQEYGDSIVAARAHVLLKELSAPPSTSPPALPPTPADLAVPTAQPPLAVPAPALAGLERPIAHWKFDEGTGTTVSDASGSGISGTLKGGATWTAAGMRGSALTFDGKNGYVLFPENALLNIVNEITLALWIKTSTAKPCMLVGGYSGTSPYAGYGLIINRTQQVGQIGQISFWSGRAWKSTASSNFNDGAWHHVAVTLSGTTASFYKDGAPDGNQTTTPLVAWSGPRALGSLSSGSVQFFAGSLDDVRIYNRALPAAEITTLAERQEQRK